MVILSSMFPLEGTLQGSSSSSESSTGRNHHWPDALKCYVCDDYFSRPRILPCGHTFCAPCLARLRTVAQQEFNKSRDRNAHRRGDSGFFTCPWPNCHYSMKIMNLGRWSLKNRTVSMAVSMIKRQEKEKQESPSQTDIDLSSAILTVPRFFAGNKTSSNNNVGQDEPDTGLQTLVVEQAIQRALSNDSFERNHFMEDPETSKTWRTYLVMVGMAILEQVFR